MDFSFSDEQQMLLDTTRRFVTERYGFDFRNGIRRSAEGWSRETWREMADLGLLAANIPESEGGLAAGAIGTMLIGNAIGEALLLEPFLASAVVATHAIVALASAEQRERWLAKLGAGELIAVLAHDEASMEQQMAIETTATRDGDGWRINGRKSIVYHAQAANLLLVSAHVDDALGLFALPTDAPGLTLHERATVDEQRAADVQLVDVRAAFDARVGVDATDALQLALDHGLAALCAEAFGAMDRLFAATIAYSRLRVQFGTPIGSFQALQHRMAEMLMHLEQARSMSYLAASCLSDADPLSRRASLAAAKVLMGQAARYIGQQAVQLHGGMGMSDELDVSHYFKRLLAFELRFGTTDRHLEAYGDRLQTPARHSRAAYSHNTFV